MKSDTGKLFAHVRRKGDENCTDYQWIMMFCVLWLIMGVMAYYAVTYSNYMAFINGYDSFGNTCGVRRNTLFSSVPNSGKDTSNKPYLLFMGYSNVSQVLKICVEHCPDQAPMYPSTLLKQYRRKNTQLCRYDFDMNILHFSVEEEFNDKLGPCPELSAYRSFLVKHRCIPLITDIRALAEMYAFISTGTNPPAAIFTNIYQVWPYVGALGCFATVLSAALLSLMRWKARTTTNVLCVLGLFSTLAVCIVEWIVILRLPPVEPDMSLDYREEEGRIFYNHLRDFRINTAVIVSVAVLSLFLVEVLLIMLVIDRERISRAGVLCEEAAKCWRQLPGLTGVALTTLVAMTIFFTYWTYVMLCTTTASLRKILPLGDMADYMKDSKGRLRLFHQVGYVKMPWLQDSHWIYIFGFVWMSEFICGCQRFWLETSVVSWYFRRGADWSLFKEHLGSVLRGSLMGVLAIPRLVCVFFCKLLASLPLKSCKFAEYFEIGLESIDEQLRMFPGIYAVVVFRNVGLHSAGKTAAAIIGAAAEHVTDASNSVHFAFISAQLLVANLTFLLGVLLLKEVDELFFYMAPVVLSAVYAFYIARILLSTIEVTLNALLLCVCEDNEVNKTRGCWSRESLLSTTFAVNLSDPVDQYVD